MEDIISLDEYVERLRIEASHDSRIAQENAENIEWFWATMDDHNNK